MRVLLCDDENSILRTIGDYLEIRGVSVDYCARGAEAVRLAAEGEFDVIVLDVKMPGISGLEACQQIREAGVMTPVLFLTARDHLDDILAGFEAGGDDYMVKPFAFEELHARIEALSRRLSRQGVSRIRVQDLQIDLQTSEVSRAGKPIHLNPIQFKLLKCLAIKSPGVVTRAQLEEAVWGEQAPESDALRTHVFNLRGAIDKPFSSPYIHTVHGVGFRLSANEATEEARETH